MPEITLSITPRQRVNLILSIQTSIDTVNTWQRYSPRAQWPYWSEQRDEYQELFDLVNGAC